MRSPGALIHQNPPRSTCSPAVFARSPKSSTLDCMADRSSPSVGSRMHEQSEGTEQGREEHSSVSLVLCDVVREGCVLDFAERCNGILASGQKPSSPAGHGLRHDSADYQSLPFQTQRGGCT